MASHINSKRPAAAWAAFFGALLLTLGLASCESPLDSTVGPHEVDTVGWVGPGERPDEKVPKQNFIFRPISIFGGWDVELSGQGVFEIPEFWFPEFLSYSMSLAVSEDNGGNATMSFSYDLQRSDDVTALPYYPLEVETLLATAIRINLTDVQVVGSLDNGFISTQGEIQAGGMIDYGVLEDLQSTRVTPVGSFPCSVTVLVIPDIEVPELLQISIVVAGVVNHPPYGDISYTCQSDFIRVPVN